MGARHAAVRRMLPALERAIASWARVWRLAVGRSETRGRLYCKMARFLARRAGVLPETALGARDTAETASPRADKAAAVASPSARDAEDDASAIGAITLWTNLSVGMWGLPSAWMEAGVQPKG